MTDIKYFLLVAIMAFFSLTAFATDKLGAVDVDIPRVRLPAPGFTLIKNGKPVSLSQYEGKIIILNFWSLACKPCRDEMGSLDSLSKIYHDKGLRVLAISINDDDEQINQFTRNKQFSIMFLADKDRELTKKYNINAVPITYIVGRDGKFVARIIGARNWSSSGIKRFIESHL